MNCSEAREAMLEADPSALLGEGDGDLARHIAGCAACRDRARHLMDGTRALDRALDTEARAPLGVRRRAPARRAVVQRLAPWGLLAAAAVVVLLVWPRGAPRRPEAAAQVPAAAGIEVDLSASPRLAAVLHTDDPNITVVWFF